MTGGWGYGEQPGRTYYIPECLRMVNRNRIVSVMVWGHWLPLTRCWQSDHSRWKREWGQLCQNIVRKPSWFCRKHIWRQKPSIRISTWQCSGQTRGVELSHGWSSRTYPPFNGHPSPRTLESCLSQEMIWFELCIMVPYSGWTAWCHICTIFPRRVKVVIRGLVTPQNID